jgi:hypothetical protein
VDNYYTSLPLVEKFLENDTYVTGTIQGNRRGLPDEIKQGQSPKDSLVQMVKGGIPATYWNDRAKVRFLSSYSSSGRVEKTNRRGVVREIPIVASLYNQTMGGVDQADHKFIINVVEDLVGKHQEPRSRKGRKRANPPGRLTERHFLSRHPEGKKLDCRLCSDRNRSRVRTRCWCKDCKVALCWDGCFAKYHTEL